MNNSLENVNRIKEDPSFIKNHVAYVRAISKAWRTGDLNSMFSFVDQDYSGVLYSQALGKVKLTHDSAKQGTYEAFKSGNDTKIRWFSKRKLLLSNHDRNERVISHRLHFFHPGPPAHESVAMMMEKWKFKLGKWLLIREVQEERDDDIQELLPNPGAYKNQLKFINIWNKYRKGLRRSEEALKFIDANFQGEIHKRGKLTLLNDRNFIQNDTNCEVGIKQRYLMSRNRKEVILHSILESKNSHNLTEVCLCSEVWRLNGDIWVLIRCFKEYV